MKRHRSNSAIKYAIAFDALPIDPADVLAAIGYEPGRTPPFLHDLMEEIFSEAEAKCAIEGGYKIYDSFNVSADRQNIHIDKRTFSTHKTIATQLKNAHQVAVFACTAGHALEGWSKALITGEDPAKGYIIDTLASLVVEAAMDIIHDDLAAESGKQALNVSNRFSPGYCEWSLTDIHQLISMLPPDFCNISLNDAAFMIPAKSICGIIGIGRKVIRSEYQCRGCDLEACVYRNKFLPGR